MTPIQQLMLGVGAKKKVYLDDVFSTFLYEGKGDNTTNSVSNNVDLTEGGMVWTKCRNITYSHIIYDSLRGQNYLTPNENYAQASDSRSNIAFNSTGYTFGDASSTSWGPLNEGTGDFASWTFRKAPGFFDIVTYTGNGSLRTISHSLGCVPGMIMIKSTSHAANWVVYHRGTGINPGAMGLKLNGADAASGVAAYWNDTMPTSTHFTLKTDSTLNEDGYNYVAYVFAGGEQKGNESVKFDGTADNLNWGSNSHLAFGTGDFTIEFWTKINSGSYVVFLDMRPNSAATNGKYPLIYWDNSQLAYFTDSSDRITGPDLNHNQWYHVAVSRSGTSTKMFLDGTQIGSTYSDSNDYLNGDTTLGSRASNTTGNLNGYISNFRITKGQALYTSNFTPSTTPLTTTSQGATADNVKILCCNDTQIENFTKSVASITLNGNPEGDKSSPFSKPLDASSIFGESGSETVIKCGTYTGDGGAGTKRINLGFEPQWLLVKTPDASDDWVLLDSIRGIGTHDNTANDVGLNPNATSAESTQGYLDLTSTGFKTTLYTNLNVSGRKYVYMAIRRPDGYVGKPADAGTDVFAMSTIQSSDPRFVSNFPVDFLTLKLPASSQGWYTSARLIQGRNVMLNETSAESGNSTAMFDFNNGAYITETAAYQGWMWKRHAGFDVVTYKGNSVSASNGGHSIAQSLSKTPEMIWIKDRDQASNWHVFHKDLTGNNILILNSTAATSSTGGDSDDFVSVSSTHFTIGSENAINNSARNYIAMLFASVDGISKIGSYTGNGSESSGPSISLGFQPRFILFRGADISGPWRVLDTLRDTLGSGTDKELSLNNTYAEADHTDWLDITSTGFDIKSGDGEANASGKTYIYYAHA